MNQLPRFPLAHLPTPITDAVRLRDALGGPSKCPRILIKRDDLTALGLGGNKARKLEYLVADALARGAGTLITTGAVQSNHARMTAAAARIAGLRCVLVLTSRHEAPALEGNLLLDAMFGAEVRFVPSEDPMLAVGRDEEVVAEVVREETAAGRVPYVIPVGGSSPVGAVGYVSGTEELVSQLEAMGASPSRLYFGSGSRGTQAGLTLGAKLSRASYALWGVAVSAGEAQKVVRAMNAANDAAALLGVPTRVESRGSLHRPGLHRRGLRDSHGTGARVDRPARADRSHPARSGLHVEGLLGPARARPSRRHPAGRHGRVPAHRRDARAVHARVRRDARVRPQRFRGAGWRHRVLPSLVR